MTPSVHTAGVEAEIEQLRTAPVTFLRNRYLQLFWKEPPKAFGPNLLRHSIAYRLQEKAYGGLSKPMQRQLNYLIKASATKPRGRLSLPKRIKPGSEMVRTWKGKSYKVTVHHDGFVYNGATYPSLSEIATHITGTKWNGPRFFGLRLKAAEYENG